MIGINEAAAKLVQPADLAIIISYDMYDDAEARTMQPTVVHVDTTNKIVSLGADPAEPVPGAPGQLRGDAINQPRAKHHYLTTRRDSDAV